LQLQGVNACLQMQALIASCKLQEANTSFNCKKKMQASIASCKLQEAMQALIASYKLQEANASFNCKLQIATCKCKLQLTHKPNTPINSQTGNGINTHVLDPNTALTSLL
ncbi:hypothetical protein Tco_1197597, partial [Tanacetum coccineum]